MLIITFLTCPSGPPAGVKRRPGRRAAGRVPKGFIRCIGLPQIHRLKYSVTLWQFLLCNYMNLSVLYSPPAKVSYGGLFLQSRIGLVKNVETYSIPDIFFSNLKQKNSFLFNIHIIFAGN